MADLGAAAIRWGRVAAAVGFVVGFAASISLVFGGPSQAYRLAGVTLAAATPLARHDAALIFFLGCGDRSPA
ncbi:hypothetical protein DIE12_31890 [Burkholderia sp. Bp9015]|nr:hypothetical protein DIE12_31890 [Burkholderia sp. Bp9015]